MESRGQTFRVIVKRNASTKFRFHLTYGLILLSSPLIIFLIASRDQYRHETPEQARLLQTKLTVRSATLVVKDLADEWQLTHYENQPFEFCGKNKLSNRQLKACADHFLSLVTGDGNMRGLPTIPAYDICMSAQNDYQLKSCIWAVSKEVTPDDFIAMQTNGQMDPVRAATLNVVAQHAIDVAIPVDPIEGLDGGLTAATAETSTMRFMKKQNSLGTYPSSAISSGCALLGMGGCESNGGMQAQFHAEAAHFVANSTVRAQLVPPVKDFPVRWQSDRSKGPIPV